MYVWPWCIHEQGRFMRRLRSPVISISNDEVKIVDNVRHCTLKLGSGQAQKQQQWIH